MLWRSVDGPPIKALCAVQLPCSMELHRNFEKRGVGHGEFLVGAVRDCQISAMSGQRRLARWQGLLFRPVGWYRKRDGKRARRRSSFLPAHALEPRI